MFIESDVDFKISVFVSSWNYMIGGIGNCNGITCFFLGMVGAE